MSACLPAYLPVRPLAHRSSPACLPVCRSARSPAARHPPASLPACSFAPIKYQIRGNLSDSRDTTIPPFIIDDEPKHLLMTWKEGFEEEYNSGSLYASSSDNPTLSPSDSGLDSDNSTGVKRNVGVTAVNEPVANVKACKDSQPAAPSEKINIEQETTQQNETADDSDDGKPPHSYIALISMAILSTRARNMLLSEIYQYIMNNFEFYNNDKKPWRNSIRHNLSLNECFIKARRSENGKGNYWTIHPACIDDFARGDFRRHHSKRRARKCTKVQYSRGMYGYNDEYIPMTQSHVCCAAYDNSTSLYYMPPPTACRQVLPMPYPTLPYPQMIGSTTSPASFMTGPCVGAGIAMEHLAQQQSAFATPYQYHHL
ncbi:forkhead box protein fkh-2-like [Mya arenaria]|uniref:forkhead box protein fkh-2-like n=1 Tax=Mya arenaria TaxID=6604 RepID=UPI0022DFAD15|nr:forkhead box protein fkh-2-like [Mya arenaria]